MDEVPHTPYRYVDTDEALADLVQLMDQTGFIAIDTEADSLHRYFQKVSLIQLSFDEQHYVVDPLSGMDLSPFLDVLRTKDLILHAGDYDLRMMKTSYDYIHEGEIFDTMLAGQMLGLEEFGLAAVALRYLDVTLPKTGQKSDWSRRPLTAAQLSYAVNDTRYLAALADLLTSELDALGRVPWHRECCQSMAEAASNHHIERDPETEWRIKRAGLLSRHQLAFLRELWHWRDEEAQRSDRPPFKVLGNQQMLDLAVWAQAHPDKDLRQGPKLPRNCTGRRLHALEIAIAKARVLRAEQWPEKRRRRRNSDQKPDCKVAAKALKTECARMAEELGIAPPMLASANTIKAIAEQRPCTLEQLRNCGPMMSWQAEIIKDAVFEILSTCPDNKN